MLFRNTFGHSPIDNFNYQKLIELRCRLHNTCPDIMKRIEEKTWTRASFLKDSSSVTIPITSRNSICTPLIESVDDMSTWNSRNSVDTITKLFDKLEHHGYDLVNLNSIYNYYPEEFKMIKESNCLLKSQHLKRFMKHCHVYSSHTPVYFMYTFDCPSIDVEVCQYSHWRTLYLSMNMNQFVPLMIKTITIHTNSVLILNSETTFRIMSDKEVNCKVEVMSITSTQDNDFTYACDSKWHATNEFKKAVEVYQSYIKYVVSMNILP